MSAIPAMHPLPHPPFHPIPPHSHPMSPHFTPGLRCRLPHSTPHQSAYKHKSQRNLRCVCIAFPGTNYQVPAVPILPCIPLDFTRELVQQHRSLPFATLCLTRVHVFSTRVGQLTAHPFKFKAFPLCSFVSFVVKAFGFPASGQQLEASSFLVSCDYGDLGDFLVYALSLPPAPGSFHHG